MEAPRRTLFVYIRRSRGFVHRYGGPVISSGHVLQGIVETCLGPEVMKIQPSRRRPCAHRIHYVPATFIEFIPSSLPLSRARMRVFAQQTAPILSFYGIRNSERLSVGELIAEVSPYVNEPAREPRRIAFFSSYQHEMCKDDGDPFVGDLSLSENNVARIPVVADIISTRRLRRFSRRA